MHEKPSPDGADGPAHTEGPDDGHAAYEVTVVPGMTWDELRGLLAQQVPPHARFLEAYGDVEMTLRWAAEDPGQADPLVERERAAWRAWRDAEDRARDLGSLLRQAQDRARLHRRAWDTLVDDLAVRRRPLPEAGAAPADTATSMDDAAKQENMTIAGIVADAVGEARASEANGLEVGYAVSVALEDNGYVIVRRDVRA